MNSSGHFLMVKTNSDKTGGQPTQGFWGQRLESLFEMFGVPAKKQSQSLNDLSITYFGGKIGPDT